MFMGASQATTAAAVRTASSSGVQLRVYGDEAMKSNSDDSPRRYLCERCGGTGTQVAGCWNAENKAYTAKAGICDDCQGTGYLGLVVAKRAAE